MGSLFQTIVEFLEKASSMFSGFARDVNYTIVETGFFEKIFEILVYFNCSDILNQKIFKIIDNILRDKNDEAHEVIQNMIVKGGMVSFLLENGPRVDDDEPKAPDEGTQASSNLGKESSGKDVGSPKNSPKNTEE